MRKMKLEMFYGISFKSTFSLGKIWDLQILIIKYGTARIVSATAAQSEKNNLKLLKKKQIKSKWNEIIIYLFLPSSLEWPSGLPLNPSVKKIKPL